MSNEKYYADYDKDTASYCVFDNEIGKAYGSYATMELAEERSDEMNKKTWNDGHNSNDNNTQLSFSMVNTETHDEVTYTIYDDYIEAICNDSSVTRMGKPDKNNNQIVMDLINNLIKQGCIISEMNLIK